MPRGKILSVRPDTLVELSAEALKIAAGVVFHLPGGLVAKGVITAGQRVLKQELDRTRRDSVIGRFVAEATYLQGDLIRIADFVRRTAPSTIAGVHSGEFASVSAADQREYRELLAQLLGRIAKLDSSVLEAAGHLTEDERGLVAQDLARVRALGINVLCGDDASPVERVGKLLEARRCLAKVAEGLQS